MRRGTAALCVCLLPVLACTGHYRKTLTGRLWVAATERPATSARAAVLDGDGRLQVELDFDGRPGLVIVECALCEQDEPTRRDDNKRFWRHSDVPVEWLDESQVGDLPSLPATVQPVLLVDASKQDRHSLAWGRASAGILVVAWGGSWLEWQVARTNDSHSARFDITREW